MRPDFTVLICILNGHIDTIDYGMMSNNKRLLYGLYIFEGSVIEETYLHLKRDELNNLFEDIDFNTKARMWFEQHEAAPHYARIFKDYVNVGFNDIISG